MANASFTLSEIAEWLSTYASNLPKYWLQFVQVSFFRFIEAVHDHKTRSEIINWEINVTTRSMQKICNVH